MNEKIKSFISPLAPKLSLVNVNSYIELFDFAQILIPAEPPGFRFGGGDILGVGLVGRPGGGAPPPDAGEFSKILKNFFRKLQ